MHTPSPQEKRWQIVFEWKVNPKASLRSIGKKVGVHDRTVKLWINRYKDSERVDDLQRPGRNNILSANQLAELKQYAVQNVKTAATSCWRLSKHVKEKHGVQVSARTIRRVLGATHWDYGPGLKAPLLKPFHKRKRMLWAGHHLKARTRFAKWMFTDSKIFLLEKIGGIKGLRFWAPRGDRPLCEVSQSNLGVHVYMGLTKTGLTRPIFVTGAGGKLSDFINPRTGQLHKGVCTQEYVQQVLPALKAQGDLKFGCAGRWSSEWVFQQDNAPCHAANATKAALQQLLPGRAVCDWPPKSPDLSPIENVWAWMENKLQTSGQSFNSVAELQAGIIDVAKSAPMSLCANLVKSVPDRLQTVIDRDGAYIGK